MQKRVRKSQQTRNDFNSPIGQKISNGDKFFRKSSKRLAIMPRGQSANRMHFELRIASALHSTSRHCGLHQTISSILQSTFRINSFFFKVFESASEINQKRLFYERLLVFEKKICDMLPQVLLLCFSVGFPTLRSFYFTKQRSCFHVRP